jgi:hypothetical protein
MIWKEGILGKKLPMIFSQFLQESGSFVVKILHSVYIKHGINSLLSNTEVYLFMYIFIYLFIK